MICKNCGNEITDSQKFCTNCGLSKFDNIFKHESLELQVLLKCAIIAIAIGIIFLLLNITQ